MYIDVDKHLDISLRIYFDLNFFSHSLHALYRAYRHCIVRLSERSDAEYLVLIETAIENSDFQLSKFKFYHHVV